MQYHHTIMTASPGHDGSHDRGMVVGDSAADLRLVRLVTRLRAWPSLVLKIEQFFAGRVRPDRPNVESNVSNLITVTGNLGQT